ncbi:MAG: immune inhibitor A [Gemmatimonadales bacterium]|nr:immune inhibitor A [Gemmatimonadales bacterium]
MYMGSCFFFPKFRFEVKAGLVVVLFLAWITGTLVADVCLAADQAPTKPYGRIPVWGRGLEDLRSLPDGDQRIERELRRQGEYFRRWHAIDDLLGKRVISRKGQALLEKRGLGPALLKSGSRDPITRPTSSTPDVLKILIVRISFETNRNPSLTTIPADGGFMLDPLEDPSPIEIDPPPHDWDYFRAHLDGLSEYYEYQSGGRLIIEGTVLPPVDASIDSYKLSDIADYGPGEGGSWVPDHVDELERLVRDMIAVTDSTTFANGTVNLAEYDDDNDFARIIFVHSGSDWQSDINGDSPNDIPTFFMTLGEAMTLLGQDTETGAAIGSLSEVSVIPETTTQDGYPGSIAAGLYHEFGHSLGLVDIYNTYMGTPNAGIWDLMDSGTNLPVTMGKISDGDTTIVTAVGVLPPSLGAWDKWFLGWAEMEEVDGRTDSYELPAVWVPVSQYDDYGFDTSYPQVLKAGVSSREFFLLENRWVPELHDVPYLALEFVRDEDTGVILYLGGELPGDEWTNSGIYDYFLPPGGVLVWHVNMDRIEAGLHDNTINVDGDGLRLVEADGIQDIGILDAYVLGWYGSANDPFSEYNGFQNLYVDGFPSSRCVDRSWSGVSLSNIREDGNVGARIMRFEAEIQGGVPGFPWEMGAVEEVEAELTDGLVGPRGINPASLISVPRGDQTFLVFTDSPPEALPDGPQPDYENFLSALYALQADGTAPWPQLADRPVGAFLQLDAPLSGPPVLFQDNQQIGHLVLGTKAGTVQSLILPPAGSSDPPVPDWSLEGEFDTLLYGPVPLRTAAGVDRWLCVPDAGTVAMLEQNDVTADTWELDISGLDIDPQFTDGNTVVAAPQVLVLPSADDLPDQGSSAVVVTEAGWVLVQQAVSGFAANPGLNSFVRFPLEQPVYTAVVPLPHSVQLHIFDARGDVGAWGIDAYGQVTELPDHLDIESALIAEPAVADVDGDGRHDLLLATADYILAVSPTGTGATGFPIVLNELFPLDETVQIFGPLIVADGTGDGANEVFFNTTGGHLFGIVPGGKLLDYTPYRWGDFGRPGMAVGSGPAGEDEGRVLWLASPGGYTGPPLDRHYINGRIMSFDLGAPTDASNRTSEWLGAGGGPEHAGPVGTAQVITIADLASASETGVYFYPNPLRDDTVTIRFYGPKEGNARFFLHNLEGEEILQDEFRVDGGVVNEQEMDLAGLVSGLYFGRLVYPAGSGFETKILTLAIER